MLFSLQARVVFPVDRPPIEQGVVTIDAERIVAVGISAIGDEPVHDLGDVALLPGLVNAHTHLEFSDLAQPLGKPGMALADWIPFVLAHRRGRDANPQAAIAAGMQESLRSGVTTIGEIATAGAAAYANLISPDVNLLIEAIGFSGARAESALQAAIQQLDAFEWEFGAVGGSLGEPGIQLGLSPHAPYTVSPALLSSLVTLARKRNLSVAMHIAESTDELELLDCGTGRFQQLLDERSMWDATAIPRGSSPFDYLRLLAQAPRALVIHGNYLDRDEHEFLATHRDRMSLVYCPRTHAYFCHSPYPLSELLAAGVRVALGTDSRASNPDLSLLAEMRHVARAHPGIALTAILRMGTLSGAEALGRERECGSITAGKLANLVAVRLSLGANGEPADVLDAILSSVATTSAIWYRGREMPQRSATAE
jgi:cytosine/adenosine deaminase-related metal-dependent hydrolase